MEVTQELSDGYEGIVRKIVCLNCQHPFYIAKDAYERIDARYCHACSLQQIGVECRRTKRPVPKEAVDQAEQGIQHAQAEDVKIEDMSAEDKMGMVGSFTRYSGRTEEDSSREANAATATGVSKGRHSH
jgi:hypothetical protein